MTSGSLGNGVAIGLGMEIARQRTGKQYFTYVITGDGELNEGAMWEGILAANKNNAENLIVFVDANGYQSGGCTADISVIEPIGPKWEAFGWHVQHIDGHSIPQIRNAVATAQARKGVPSAIIAKTVKGKGVSFMEDNNEWHKRAPTYEERLLASEELGVAGV